MGFTGWPAVAGATPITAEASTDCGWNQLVEAVNERIAVAQTRGYWGVALSPVAPGDPVNVVNMRVLRQVVEDLLWFYLDPETGNDWDYSLGKTGFLEMAIGQSDWTDPVLVGKSEETPGNPATPIRAAHVNEIRLAVQHLLWIYPSNPIDTTWRYTREGLDTFYDWDWDGSWDRARTAFEAASYVYSLTGSAATLIGQRSYDVPSWPPSRKNLINSKVCMRLIFTGTLDPAGIPVVAARMKFRYMRWNQGGDVTAGLIIHDRGNLGGVSIVHADVPIPLADTWYYGVFDAGSPDYLSPEFSFEPIVPTDLDTLKPSVPGQFQTRTRGFDFQFQALYVRPDFEYV